MTSDRPRRSTLLEAPCGLSLAPDAVLELDADGVVLAANDVARELFLLDEADVPGVAVGSLFRDAMPLLDAVGPGGEPLRRNLKLQGLRTNGVPFPVEASVRRMTSQDEVRALCVARQMDFAELI